MDEGVSAEVVVGAVGFVIAVVLAAVEGVVIVTGLEALEGFETAVLDAGAPVFAALLVFDGDFLSVVAGGFSTVFWASASFTVSAPFWALSLSAGDGRFARGAAIAKKKVKK